MPLRLLFLMLIAGCNCASTKKIVYADEAAEEAEALACVVKKDKITCYDFAPVFLQMERERAEEQPQQRTDQL